MRTQMPKAVSPSQCRMMGDRNRPTRTSQPRENQVEPTFLMIWRLLIAVMIVAASIGARLTVMRGELCWLTRFHPDGQGFRVEFPALQLVAEKIHERKPGNFDLFDGMARQTFLPSARLSRSDERNFI